MVAEGAHSWTAGEVIAEKYVLLRPIAKGGMGSVWVAQNKLTERKVAIKFMLPELSSSPDTIQRFFREAKASARIDHPSIVDVLDLGTLPDGAPFLVMEYLEGRSFEKIIDAAPLAPVQAAVIMLDVARALSAAHTAGIVHRDLKPANIFIAKKGDLIIPKILDFGISKITSSMGDIRMTRTGAVLGSPAYMSPEQARGRSDIDGRADIWAVGVILYEAISGKLPFIGENYNQVMMAITLDPPTPLVDAAPSADRDFVAIVEACLQKDRDNRPPSMEALAALLDAYVAPRAAYGIPPIDIGEGASSKSSRVGSTYRLASNVSPQLPTSVPPDATATVRSNPVQMTVGAVTMVDPPRRRSRAPLAIVAVAAAAVLGVGGWALLRRTTDVKDDRNGASTSAVATTNDTVDKKPAPAATPSETAPEAVDATAPIGTAAASTPATTTASATTTATASETAAPSATTTATMKPKPYIPPKVKPSATVSATAKPSASAKPSGDIDGPAPVGTGPGF